MHIAGRRQAREGSKTRQSTTEKEGLPMVSLHQQASELSARHRTLLQHAGRGCAGGVRETSVG